MAKLEKNKRSTSEQRNKNISDKNKNNKSKSYVANTVDDKPNYFLIPIIIVLCIIPMIVRLKIYNPNLGQFSWFSNATEYPDLFLYYKQWAFIFVSGLMAIVIVCRAVFFRKTIRPSYHYIPLAVYALLALLSAIFSDYASFSFSGSFEQFESVFALLGYCIVTYYAYLFIDSERDLKLIMRFLIISVAIMSILGLFQYLGYDLFSSELGYKLIIPSELRNGRSLDFNFGVSRVYLTLYNPNYVGVYASLLIPLILVIMFFQKKLIPIIISLLTIIGLVMCIVGAQSLTAFISLGIAVFVFVIFMWRHLFKRLYITIPLILILFMSLFVINNISDQLLVNRLKSAMKIDKTEYNLSRMETLDDHINLLYLGKELNIKYILEDNRTVPFEVYDNNNKDYEVVYDQTNKLYAVYVNDTPFIVLTIDSSNANIFYLTLDGGMWSFTNNTEDGTYYLINRFGKLDKMITAPTAVFTGYERIASGRGYIWSRSIPLLKEYLVLGSGPDTFTMAYPQQDYLSLYNNSGGTETLTKPHSLYLQIGIQTGVVSLIAFLLFYGIYFISCVRLYSKGRFNSYFAKVGLAIFIGSISYMITGISNDSSITTAPIFWALIGIGIAANYKAKPLILEEMAALKLKKAEKKMLRKEKAAMSEGSTLS